MADVLVASDGTANIEINGGLWGPYWVSPLIGALIYIDGATDLNYARTTDGGANWAITEIETNSTIHACAYFDQEMPGDSGTLLHIWWIEQTNGELMYRTLDIATGTLGTERAIATLASGTTAALNSRLWACKTRNGNLLVGGRCDLTTGTDVSFCYRSVDAGVNWTSRTTGHEDNNVDAGYLFPANTGDDADAALIYQDDSAPELSVKMYDDSLNTWTETLIASGVDPGTFATNALESSFHAALRHSDGVILVIGWSGVALASGDLRAFTVNPNSITTPAVAEATNVITDTEGGGAAIAINQQNDDVYVGYMTGNWAAAVSVLFKVSNDDMSTWGSGTAYSEAAVDDLKRVTGPRSIAALGGRIQWAFYNDDEADIFVNLTNDVEITDLNNPSGTGNVTLPNLVASASGFEHPRGDSQSTLPSLVASAVGVIQPSGQAVVTLPSLTASGIGVLPETVAGMGDTTLPSLVASATGKVSLSLSGQIQLPSLSSAGVSSVDTELTTSFSIPVELLASASEAGSPDTILSIPRGEQVHRLSAYLFDWEVTLRPIKGPNDMSDAYGFLAAQQITDEYIGAKVGPGPILDFIDFRYDWKIDSIGEWTATVPAVDANVEPALTREAKVIQFYFEGIGLILIGWITDHEVDGEGNIQLHGYDMSVFLSRRSSFYRHLMNAGHPGLYPGAAAMLLPATYTLVFLPFTSSPSYTRRYQNHTVADMWNDLNQIYGTHWRMLPNQMVIEIGPMGDDSGKIAAPVNEEDPSVIDQGALVITNVRYAKSDDEIINCVLAQGSNNSFGVSVELRHTSLQRKFGKISFTQFISISFPGWDEDSAFYLDQSGGVIPAGVDTRLGQPGSSAADTDILAIAQKITIAEEYDLAYVAHFGYRTAGLGVAFGSDPVIFGIFRLDICPDDGTGQPDTTNPVHSAYCSNFPSVPAVPSVQDHGEMRNFSELMFFPNNTDGYWRIPSGDYWFVLSLAVNPGGFGFLGTPGTFAPTRLGIGVWGQGVTPSVLYDLVDGVSTFISTAVMDGTGAWTVDGNYAGLKLVMEVSGRYNTASDRALYPYLVEGQFAQGIDDSLPTSGQRVFFIRDNTSIVEWGLRERVVSFPNAIDSREGLSDIEPASNVLYGAAVTYLNRHKDLFETLSFDVVGYFELPRPGQKIRVVFRGQAELENGKYVWLDIDGLFWVMSISTSINGDGVTHNFTVTSVPENLLDPEAIPHEILRGVNRANNYFAEVEYGTHVGIDPFPNEI